MISFTDEDKIDLDALTEEERACASEYLGMSAENADGDEVEIRYAISHGCLLFRLFDGAVGYYFWPAVPLSESADASAAYADISEYCLLEAVREVYLDLPAEDVELVTLGKTHPTVTDISDGEGEAFAVEIDNECTLLSDLPEIMYEDIYLGEIALAYAKDYERLVTDRELNKYYGYDILADVPDGGGEELISFVRAEFDRREALTLAATVLSEEGENVFIGEGTLYAFRGDSTASVAFRILPEWQGKGYGKKLYLALARLACEIGLTALHGEVYRENLRSIALMNKVAVCLGGTEKVEFLHDLR